MDGSKKLCHSFASIPWSAKCAFPEESQRWVEERHWGGRRSAAVAADMTPASAQGHGATGPPPHQLQRGKDLRGANYAT